MLTDHLSEETMIWRLVTRIQGPSRFYKSQCGQMMAREARILQRPEYYAVTAKTGDFAMSEVGWWSPLRKEGTAARLCCAAERPHTLRTAVDGHRIAKL
jgi:hypothetical protein